MIFLESYKQFNTIRLESRQIKLQALQKIVCPITKAQVKIKSKVFQKFFPVNHRVLKTLEGVL